MRTTVYQKKEKLIVKDGEINIAGYWLSDSSGWLREPKLLRQELIDQFRPVLHPDLHPYKVELSINNKFIIDVEIDDISDELDFMVIERFDELKLNFSEEVRIKIVAISH